MTDSVRNSNGFLYMLFHIFGDPGGGSGCLPEPLVLVQGDESHGLYKFVDTDPETLD